MLKRIMISGAIIAALSSSAWAADLGPSTNSGIGSDSTSLNLLQPAGPGGLQSANSQGSGINQPSSSTNLQPAGSSADAAPLLTGNQVHGAPVSGRLAAKSSSRTSSLLSGAIGLVILVCALYVYRISRILEARTTKPTPTKPDAKVDDTKTSGDASAGTEEAQAAEPEPTPESPKPTEEA